MEGTYGGWEPGEATGRAFVLGQVAVLETDSSLSSHDPQEIARPIVTIELVTWEEFIKFLWLGEYYE